MIRCIPLLILALAGIPGTSRGQSLVDGTNYPGLFGPADDVTVVPGPGLLVIGGTASGALGSYWDAEANGGLRVVALGQTGAQVALNGSELQFRISNSPDSLLGAAGIGAGLALDWSATATFDAPGNQLLLAPSTTYQVTFDVDGSSGLLNSTLGLTPSFGLEFLDGDGDAIGSVGEGSLVNIIGLELLGIVGSPPELRRATVQFQTGSTVAAGPAGLRFTGSALLPATVLGLGTEFASVSNIQIAAVPEPSVFGLSVCGALFALRRRRAAA